jgi:hypothetical protein
MMYDSLVEALIAVDALGNICADVEGCSLFDRLMGQMGQVPMLRLNMACEAGWAERSLIPPDGLQILSDLIGFAALNRLFRFNDSALAANMVKAIQRDLGHVAPDGLGWPDPQNDPVAMAEYELVASTQSLPPQEALTNEQDGGAGQ